MSIQTIADLKALWVAGYTPTQEDFANLFDTLVPYDPATGQILSADGTQLTGVLHSETDPVVGAVAGLVMANGAGTISAATAGVDFATAAQGATADTALQPAGDGSGLSGVLKDASAFATAAQGTTADTALQLHLITDIPTLGKAGWLLLGADLALMISSQGIAGNELSFFIDGGNNGVLKIGETGQDLRLEANAAAGHHIVATAPLVDADGNFYLKDAAAFATAAQGSTADTALQPNATADGTYPIMNDGITSGQLTGITIANGLITAVTVVP